MMPPKGAAARAEASATLSGVIHERFISDEIGRLLDQVASLETELGHDSDDASLVRVTRREWEKARRVPAEIAAAWAREGGKAHVAWLEAREQNDFSIFLPALRRVHDVALRWAELMGQGRLNPVIDRTYPLQEARAAQELMLSRRFFGKILLTM